MDYNEFLLMDRIQKIQSVINKYGEENFYISFSGGKDSTVLHHLIDEAVPGNKIPRVHANTGIEFQAIEDFVNELAKTDDRITIIKPSVPIKPMLEKEGYPFKSKGHSETVAHYQKHGEWTTWVKHYLGIGKRWASKTCPEILKYQFTDECKLKISDKCCFRMKEEPLAKWQKENNKPYAIIGLMRDEGGGAGQAHFAWRGRERSSTSNRWFRPRRHGKSGMWKNGKSNFANSTIRHSASKEPGARDAPSTSTFRTN